MSRTIKGLMSAMMATVSLSGTAAAAQNDNHVYAGLGWTVKQGWIPSAIIGVRNVDVDSVSDVTGVDLSLSYHFTDGFDKLLLKGVRGEIDWQAELGGGYDFLDQSLLLTGGVQGRLVNFSMNASLEGKVDGGLALNSIDKYGWQP
ncbi:hypothetical protein [Endozoicomonas sp. SCSIO W0465]|uniref:hypothetical protein n=1 Tax=Endozoicomonas sp. SCSIO W0465 TaxID=2918516 RepID=UPI0020754CEA|nr:hypothetical protein [Endozoicomonas sp. SCSIO W0465]USE34779.1 hypothetical protein MJO57_22005 [Endozoicomonas sp. SCSIO W0465]